MFVGDMVQIINKKSKVALEGRVIDKYKDKKNDSARNKSRVYYKVKLSNGDCQIVDIKHWKLELI